MNNFKSLATNYPDSDRINITELLPPSCFEDITVSNENSQPISKVKSNKHAHFQRLIYSILLHFVKFKLYNYKQLNSCIFI